MSERKALDFEKSIGKGKVSFLLSIFLSTSFRFPSFVRNC